MSLSLDLNIGEEILEHLKIEDAIREIISNAFDEHTMNNIDKQIEIFKKNKEWIIRDFGTGIREKHFKIEINKNKIQRYDVAGMFGFGLKDAIAILNNKKIEITIVTKKYVFKPMIKCKTGIDEKTLHIEVTKNKTIELEENVGTEFRFLKLKDCYVEKAKQKFVAFINPTILHKNAIGSAFVLDKTQSIFINGVEVYENTNFHLSYDLISTDAIKKSLNRDRKQIDIKILNQIVENFLLNIKLYDVNDKIMNQQLFDILANILSFDIEKRMQEFSKKNIIRNIITQINDKDNYMFIGKTEKINKYKQNIEKCGCNKFILGDAIKSKFKIKNIKDLYSIEKFYGNKKQFFKLNNIHTILSHVDKTKYDEQQLQYKINSMITNLEKTIKIPDNIKHKLTKITIDESLNDEDFDFSDSFVISEKISDKKLAGILFEYILANIDDKEMLYEKLGELLISKKSWFGFF
jgi:hypothetical protein